MRMKYTLYIDDGYFIGSSNDSDNMIKSIKSSGYSYNKQTDSWESFEFKIKMSNKL